MPCVGKLIHPPIHPPTYLGIGNAMLGLPGRVRNRTELESMGRRKEVESTVEASSDSRKDDTRLSLKPLRPTINERNDSGEVKGAYRVGGWVVGLGRGREGGSNALLRLEGRPTHPPTHLPTYQCRSSRPGRKGCC